ncbi:RidA family protein [Carboxydochorda subterranea]|uniref:RidA family protein n=1 Tax=Carboxydichorda subterranea TaxID=3109565 RepID=A0ABZ1BY84_9FIRM|nr:RidA family protein [Limnochorda sp. L945t]WRP17553.1 RidA family protein [Limnochorda sp. L945t]
MPGEDREQGPRVLVPAPGRPFSRAVRAGGLVWLSGVTPPADVIRHSPDDAGRQTEACLRRIQQTLEEAGLSLRHVARVTVYLARASDFEAMNAAYRGFFPSDPPARTTVVTGLVVPQALVEIEAVAAPDP